MSFRRIVLDTAAVSSAGIMRLLAQFVAIPILARLLSPADYGVLAMAMPFVLFAMMIAEAGIGMSLVRTPAEERTIWSTCFWVSLALGMVLTAIMAASAPLASMLLAEPRLKPVVMSLSAVVLIQAAASVPGAMLQKKHLFRKLAVTETVAIVCGVSVAVAIALSGGGVWALVWQQIVFYSVRVTLVCRFAGFRPVLRFDLHEAKEHLLFGRDVLGVNLVGFFSRSLDNLIIGRALASAAVGVYSMAFQFARLPAMIVTGPLQYVIYAKLAHVKDDVTAVRATFLVLTRILALIIFPGLGMVAVAYQPVFTLMLSQKWAASGRLFMLAAPACALQAVTALSGTIMLVLGYANIRLRTTLELGIVWVAALLFSVRFGLEWAVVAYDVAVISYSPRMLMLVLPHIECPQLTYWKTMLVPLAVTAACIMAYLEIRQWLSQGQWAQLVAAGGLAVSGIALSAMLQRRRLMQEIRLLGT